MLLNLSFVSHSIFLFYFWQQSETLYFICSAVKSCGRAVFPYFFGDIIQDDSCLLRAARAPLERGEWRTARLQSGE